MELKPEAERPILKRRLLLCTSPTPRNWYSLSQGKYKGHGQEKTWILPQKHSTEKAKSKKWEPLPDHSVHEGERINSEIYCSEKTKSWAAPYHLTGGENLILLLRLESRMEIGCEGPWKFRQLSMIYMIKVCQETLPLGFVQNCVSVPF